MIFLALQQLQHVTWVCLKILLKLQKSGREHQLRWYNGSLSHDVTRLYIPSNRWLVGLGISFWTINSKLKLPDFVLAMSWFMWLPVGLGSIWGAHNPDFAVAFRAVRSGHLLTLANHLGWSVEATHNWRFQRFHAEVFSWGDVGCRVKPKMPNTYPGKNRSEHFEGCCLKTGAELKKKKTKGGRSLTKKSVMWAHCPHKSLPSFSLFLGWIFRFHTMISWRKTPTTKIPADSVELAVFPLVGCFVDAKVVQVPQWHRPGDPGGRFDTNSASLDLDKLLQNMWT